MIGDWGFTQLSRMAQEKTQSLYLADMKTMNEWRSSGKL